MSVDVIPHLNFSGEARVALEFYRTVFGGDLTIVTYEDLGNVQEPGDAKLVMWGQVAADSGFKIMAFDVTSKVPFDKGQNAFYVVVSFSTDEEAKTAWKKLTDGASVRHELGPAPWAPMYGMLQDKFGVIWVLDVARQANAS